MVFAFFYIFLCKQNCINSHTATIPLRQKSKIDQTTKVLTGNPRSVGVLVRVLHVFHEGLAPEEHLVAEGARGGVGAPDEGGVLL